MRQYILRRVGLAVLALWALATVVFALVELGGDDAMSLFRIYRPVNWEFFRIYPPDFQGH